MTPAAGWAITAAGGLPILAGAYTQMADTYGNDLLDPLLSSAGAGIMLAGVLIAISQQPSTAGRMTVVALTVGLLLAAPLRTLTTPTSGLRILTPEIFFPAATSALALLAAMTALAYGSSGADSAVRPPQERGRTHIVSVVAAASVISLTGNAVVTAATGGLHLQDGPDPGFAPRVEFASGLARYSTLAAAIIAIMPLAWYALRRRNAVAAGWILTCLALAAPMHMLHSMLFIESSSLSELAAATAAAAAGVVSGRTLSAWRWDAPGVVAIALGIELCKTDYHQDTSWPAALWLTSALCFTLTAGLTRVFRAARSSRDGRDAAVLGLAAMLLVGQALSPFALEAGQAALSGADTLTVTVLIVAVALLLAVLALTAKSDRPDVWTRSLPRSARP